MKNTELEKFKIDILNARAIGITTEEEFERACKVYGYAKDFNALDRLNKSISINLKATIFMFIAGLFFVTGTILNWAIIVFMR